MPKPNCCVEKQIKKKGRNNLDFFASEFLQNIQGKGEQGFNHSSETASGGVL